MRRLIDAARKARDDDKAGIGKIARQRLREFRGQRPRHCASRRSQSSAASAPRACRAPRAGAADRRSWRAAADRRPRRAQRRLTPSLLQAASSARASSSLQMRPGRAAPPRRASSGSRSSAAAASPQWRSRAWKVRGPTLSERISRSRLSRSVSVRCVVLVARSCMHGQCCATARCDQALRLACSGGGRGFVRSAGRNMPMISLADLQRRIAKGELSADAAIAQSLEAIAAQDKAIGAFVCHDPQARAAKEGPLRGIAVGIKDIIDTADFPTEMGSPIYRGNRPRGDAPVVAMLKRAGATIVGKTTTTAFAANDPTATLNPHNHGHTPGGSSSGSAASVGGGHDPAGAGHADRRLGDPAGLVLRRGGDQAELPAAADRRRQMLFVDARHRRAVRGRCGRSRMRPCRDDGAAGAAAAGVDSAAAHRRGDAGFCRRR